MFDAFRDNINHICIQLHMFGLLIDTKVALVGAKWKEWVRGGWGSCIKLIQSYMYVCCVFIFTLPISVSFDIDDLHYTFGYQEHNALRTVYFVCIVCIVVSMSTATYLLLHHSLPETQISSQLLLKIEKVSMTLCKCSSKFSLVCMPST